MPRSQPNLPRRAVAGLAMVLSSASCMPFVSQQARTAARSAAPAAPVASISASATAAPSAFLLRPPPNVVAADTPSILAAPSFTLADAPAGDADRAAECLTAAVYYEARSEPVDGQRAVAQVVLNRVRNPAFPASVCGVVYQRAPGGGGCQFTFVCDGSMLRPRDAVAWRRARRIATDALDGDVYAPAGAATFYHTVAVSPWWAGSLTRIATIGAHIFYRLGDGWRGALDFRQSYAAAEPRDVTAVDGERLAANAVRTVLADGDAVVVHRGTTTVEGVVVHHGMPSDAPIADEAVASTVRVHHGPPPAGDTPTDAL